jgi:hypothetical protein
VNSEIQDEDHKEPNPFGTDLTIEDLPVEDSDEDKDVKGGTQTRQISMVQDM